MEYMDDGRYEAEADRLLAAHAGRGDHPCYPESALPRLDTRANLEEYVEVKIEESGPSVTLAALMRDCTRRQREIARLARQLAPSAKRRQVAITSLVAERTGKSRQAVHAILSRTYDRMEARYRLLCSREASPEVEAVFRSEQAHKRRQVYRKPARGWPSAYVWSRKKWKH